MSDTKARKPVDSEAIQAPKAQRTQISATINTNLLRALDRAGFESGRNRSEMLDRAIEFYLAHQQQPRH